MNELKAFFVDNLNGFSPKIIPGFLFSFVVCAALSFLLSRFYIRFGNSLSNRKAFARNFVVLAITTMFIITVVKSSLALSLGLVGALSIVRFRTAIKEPEELTYLFMTIAIGLGCGAGSGLTLLTCIAFIGFIAIIWLYNKRTAVAEAQSLYLTISSDNPSSVALTNIVELLKQHADGIKLKRTDESNKAIEASFFVEFDSFEKMEAAKAALRNIHPSVSIAFMDNTRDI
jgi:uncharacterized membrane protein YhiD involved in acid resistance